MRAFVPGTITLRGRLLADGRVEDVFPLFSPQGERLWVPGWDPEFLHPPGPEWKAGQIFRTREDSGEAVWLITRLEPARHAVEYHRVEPGRYVVRIEVICRPLPDRGTEASTTYSFMSLSEAGNRDIAAMSQEEYDAKMSRWAQWINRHLQGPTAAPRP